MTNITRFGVSMDRELVQQLDMLTQTHQYANRSEMLRSLVREKLIEHNTEEDEARVCAVVTLIFHYSTSLIRVPIDIYPSLKLSSNLQMHLQDDIVIKILIATGLSKEVKEWADQIIGQKEVVGKITIAATDTLYQELRK